MMRFLIALVISLGLGYGVAAQERAADADIESVINSQMEAFLRDDFATAFTFASPGIQSLFGTPDRFGAMVQQGYPMVYRSQDVQFLRLEERNGKLYQIIQLRDEANASHILEYAMIRAPEGWRIDGVRFLPQPGLGA